MLEGRKTGQTVPEKVIFFFYFGIFVPEGGVSQSESQGSLEQGDQSIKVENGKRSLNIFSLENKKQKNGFVGKTLKNVLTFKQTKHTGTSLRSLFPKV